LSTLINYQLNLWGHSLFFNRFLPDNGNWQNSVYCQLWSKFVERNSSTRRTVTSLVTKISTTFSSMPVFVHRSTEYRIFMRLTHYSLIDFFVTIAIRRTLCQLWSNFVERNSSTKRTVTTLMTKMSTTFWSIPVFVYRSTKYRIL
jgi:hypothetical protein